MKQTGKSGVVLRVGMPRKDDAQATRIAGSFKFYLPTGGKKASFTIRINGVTAYHMIVQSSKINYVI